jgi:hypothetical protein
MRKAEAHGDTPTLAAVVHRAVEVTDPAGIEEGANSLLARFEDRDEPVTAPRSIEDELAEAKGAVDPQDEDPVAMMTTAVATYLAHRRTELERDREELLALAARAEFGGKPPEPVARWLAAQGSRSSGASVAIGPRRGRGLAAQGSRAPTPPRASADV